MKTVEMSAEREMTASVKEQMKVNEVSVEAEVKVSVGEDS